MSDFTDHRAEGTEPVGLSEERLREIEARLPGTPEWQIHDDRWVLLAEVKRLRERLDAFRDDERAAEEAQDYL